MSRSESKKSLDSVAEEDEENQLETSQDQGEDDSKKSKKASSKSKSKKGSSKKVTIQEDEEEEEDSKKKKKSKSSKSKKSKERALDDEYEKKKQKKGMNTLNSVSSDLDNLSNHLAKTFTAFEKPSSNNRSQYGGFQVEFARPAISYQRSYDSFRSNVNGPYGYQGNYNEQPGYNHYEDGMVNVGSVKNSRIFPPEPQGRTHYGYNREGPVIPQRNVFNNDRNDESTPFFRESRDQMYRPKRQDFGDNLPNMEDTRYRQQMQQRPPMFQSYSRGFNQQSHLGNSKKFEEEEIAERYYAELYAKANGLQPAKRDIRELYSNKPRHLFVEPEPARNIGYARSASTGNKIKASQSTQSSVNIKNGNAIYINRGVW